MKIFCTSFAVSMLFTRCCDGEEEGVAEVAEAGADGFAARFYRAQGLPEVADYLARLGASPSAKVA